jgi:hypothetical protein
MKTIKKIFFITIIFLLGLRNAYASPHPPNPGGKKPPPPPGLPIDESLFVLLIIAIFFGIYIIYNHQFKTKNPT